MRCKGITLNKTQCECEARIGIYCIKHHKILKCKKGLIKGEKEDETKI